MAERERIMGAVALVLLAACGGLAEDGPRLGLDAATCPGGPTCSDERRASEEPWPEAPARDGRASGGAAPSKPASGSDTELGTEERATESSPRLGDPCEVGSGIGPERIAVGDVVLETNGSCGAGMFCLMRAPREEGSCDAELGSREACEAAANGHVVPVPPSSLALPPPLDGACSCHCDGPYRDEDYCACPADMTCRELIMSSGANGAARTFLGSYCVF